MQKVNVKSFAIGVALAGALLLPILVLADPSPGGGVGGSTVLPNPLGDAVTPAEIAKRVINTLLGVTGIMAFLVFVYGGVQYMFSGGNSQKVEAAKNAIVYATLGLAIIFASRMLLDFVLRVMVGATGVR